MMSRVSPRVCAIVVLLIAFCVIADAQNRTIRVTGNSVLKVAPDRVTINLTIVSIDDDLIRVRTTSDEQADAVLKLAQKHGGSEDSLDVSRLKLALSYNKQLRRQIYHVERDAAITLNDLSKLNPLLSELLKLKDTTVKTISFSTSKAEAFEKAAREKAFANAQSSATHLAQLSKLKLGKAVSIDVVDVSHQPFVTSVSPVVGQADDPFAVRRNTAPRTLLASAVKAKPIKIGSTKPGASEPKVLAEKFQLTSTTQKKQQPKAANKAAQRNANSHGTIRVIASVTITYEMHD